MLCTITVIICMISSCHLPAKSEPTTGEPDVHSVCSYPRIEMSEPVWKRTGVMPDVLMKYLKTIDNCNECTQFVPPQGAIPFQHYFQSLPNRLHEILQRRLLAYYFVAGLKSSGATVFVRDTNGEIYSFVLLNPRVLKLSISQLLTERESTIFIWDSANTTIEVVVGAPDKAFAYVLRHEAVHVADFAFQLTPFIVPIDRRSSFIDQSIQITHIWKTNSQPSEAHEFPFRPLFTFYGSRGGPLIPVANALHVYEQLSFSPFASTYGAQNSVEDIAELISLGSLCDRTHLCEIAVKSSGVTKTYPLMTSPTVQKRLTEMVDSLDSAIKNHTPRLVRKCEVDNY